MPHSQPLTRESVIWIRQQNKRYEPVTPADHMKLFSITGLDYFFEVQYIGVLEKISAGGYAFMVEVDE